MIKLTPIFLFLCCTALQAKDIPILLVKGYGPHIAQMLKYQGFLKDDGIAENLIHVIEYDQDAKPADLQKGAQNSLAKIVAKFPADTQFDIITHSFGGFVGLYTALPAGLAPRIRKYVTLAGVTRGQDSLVGCDKGLCGQTLPQLIPFMNPFIQGFMDKYRTELDKLEKCSLYSYEDNIVHAPADSGALPGSKKIAVKDAKHMDFIWKRELYDLMRHQCYGVAAPKAGFSYSWHEEK